MNLQLPKNQIRKQILKKRVEEPQNDLQKATTSIINRLKERTEFKEAKSVMLYIPIKNEVDTIPLIKEFSAKKKIIIPRINEKDEIEAHKIQGLTELETGKFGIPEASKDAPLIDINQIELIVVPGVAFDYKGLRIGYGKGYYDKFLKKINCYKIALAYDFQILNTVPQEPHDEKVDLIITETQTIITQ